MQEPGQEQHDVVVPPPVPVDPVFAEAVEDALAGEQPPSPLHDPYRLVGADPHDFAGLYIRHRSSLALQARRFLPDQRDVDEVVQEAFLRLFLALPELETELQALAYCRRTVMNLCIDRYRADRRRPRMVDLDSVPPDALPDDECADPVVQAEDAAIVRSALALLSPLHREALVKREIEDKPLPVIAVELGVPQDSVKHLLHRARRALRRRLAETHLTPDVPAGDVSTLNLLVRSAASGGGRLGLLALVFLGAALSASSNVPADAVHTLSGIWAQEPARGPAAPPVPRPAPHPAPRPAPRPAPVALSPADEVARTDRPDADLSAERPGRPGPPVAARAPATLVPTPRGPGDVAVVPPAPASTVTVGTSPSPGTVSSSSPVPPGPTPSPTASRAALEEPSPEPSGGSKVAPQPSSSASPSASTSPPAPSPTTGSTAQRSSPAQRESSGPSASSLRD